MRRATAVGLVLLGLCGAGTAGAQDAVRSTLPETGFFSVRVGDLPARTMTVVADGRQLLLPFTDFMEETGWAHGLGTGERFWSESEDDAVTADTALHQLTHGELTVQLDSAELRIIDGTAYVAVERIAELLRATADVDWPTLALRFDQDQPFPAEVAAASERRRAALVPAAVAARTEQLPYRPRWGGLVLDWEYSAAGLDPSRNATFSPTLSTALWGGELRMGALVGTDARGDAAPVRPVLGYSRTFPTSSAVRRIDLGDVLTAGVVAEQLRGFRITNTPHRQADVFGLIPIRADLPPGWEYEVYQDGRLVGFSDAISDGAPPAAVRYGTTGIRIREIAPDGAERTRSLTFAVPFSMAPKGALRYDLGGGACRWQACSWGAFGSVRYGLTHGLTVGGGANYRRHRDSAVSTIVPHASLALGTSRGVSGEVQVERGGAGQAMLQFTAAGLSLSGGARIDRAFAGPGVTDGRRFWSSDASAAIRIGRLSTARLSARVDGQVQAGVQRWSGGAALFHRAGTVELGYSGGPHGSPRWDVRSTYLAPRFRHSLPASLTGGVSLGTAGVERVDAGLSLGLFGFGGITASARWEQGHRKPLLELGFTASRGGFRVLGRGSSDRSRSPSRLLVHGSGSVAWVGMAGLRMAPGRSRGAGGITGRVFFDRDGDGSFTAADSALAGQEVHVGGHAVLTDASGFYSAWGLAPYEPAAVRLPDAGASLTATNPERRVRPNPNRPETVDFALVSTRAVSGQLTGADALGGVRLELRDAQGQVTETTTYEDGAWYVPRLRTGVYVVTVAESALRALEAAAEPVQLRVPADGDEELIAPLLTLRWTGGAVAAASDDDSDQNHQSTVSFGAGGGQPRAQSETPANEEDHADQHEDQVRRAAAPGRDDERVQQLSEATRGRGRADRGAGSAGAVGAVRRGILAGRGGGWDGSVEHRAPVLHDGSPAEAGAAAELPVGAAGGGGSDAGTPGDAPQREPESEQPPEELIYVVEERRTVRVRRGIARLVAR